MTDAQSSSPPPTITSQSVDPDEIARFAKIAADWWNPTGQFRPLHKLNPVRLGYIKDLSALHFDRGSRSAQALTELSVLDVGCGGGLLCEPMARLGAQVTGIDPGQTAIEAARVHANQAGLTIDYQSATAEALAANGAIFDIVLMMEVVEHVADMPAFVATVARLVRPGGLLFASTINRTRKAQLLAIFGAERVLRWLPVGTHDYEKLVTPEELEGALTSAGLSLKDLTGVVYNPLADTWSISSDTDVNYMLVAERV